MKVLSNSHSDIIKQVSSFGETLQKLDKEFPSKINLLNEIKINENTHSKILFRLLNQKINREKYLLKSFIEELMKPNSTFIFRENYDNYVLTLEWRKIDLLIHSPKQQAIIIENKVNDANDQENQLENYIEVCKNELGLDEENIFVVYLTRFGGIPTLNSLSDETRNRFKDRFILVSYSNFIYRWLDDLTNHEKLKKDENLIQNIKFYQQHLGYKLKIDNIEQKKSSKMIEELENHCFGRKNTSDFSEKLKIIEELENNATSLQESLKGLKVKIKFEEYAEKLKNEKELVKFKDKVLCDKLDTNYFIGFKAKINENKFYIVLEDNLGGHPYFGFRKGQEDNSLNQNLKNELQNIISDDFKEEGWWYGYKNVENIEKPYEEFKRFLLKCLKDNYRIEIIQEDIK